MSHWSVNERAWFLLIVAVIGLSVYYGFDDKPKPPTKPTLTQSQLDQAVSMLDRHGNTTIANKAKIMKLETRLKQLELRMNATLPDPLREVQK